MARFKIDLAATLACGPVHLELGCGTQRYGDRIGVDMIDSDAVDIVADLSEEGLAFLPDDSVDTIHSHHFLEHLSDLAGFLSETLRVLKPTGHHYAVVPHFSNPFYYSDPTHVTPFGLYTMAYYAQNAGDLYSRVVPDHYSRLDLHIHDQILWFRSRHPATILRRGKRSLNRVVNRSRRSQEFYEENLSSVLPCYELRIRYGPSPVRSDAVADADPARIVAHRAPVIDLRELPCDSGVRLPTVGTSLRS